MSLCLTLRHVSSVSASPQTKIALYYHFAPIPDPQAVQLWQRTLCASLGLTGRIIISEHGINGTVGGPIRDVKAYVKATREYAPFTSLTVKWSDGSDEDFPRLSVKVRPELVAFDAPDEIEVNDQGVVGTAEHLSPQQLHELVENQKRAGEDVVFFDGRNRFEAEIGRFKNAVVPDVDTTRDFVAELDSGKYDHLKDQPVVTYCTGGIRCEVLTVLMANRGFKNLYQLDGGIVKYGEAFADRGLWEGSLYVFDQRMHTEFSSAAKTIGHCILCEQPSSQLRNCHAPGCRHLQVVCDQCEANHPDRICEVCASTFEDSQESSA